MLVSNETSKNQYVGDGGATEFAYTFPILDAAHIEVYRQLPDQTAQEAILVPTSEYTVEGAGVESGGKVVFKTAPSSGTKLSILRNVPITQLYQYQELDSFPAESHENALAKLTMICQALAERLGRAIVISPTDSTTPEELRNEIFRMYAEILLADQNVKTALGNFFCASITPFTTTAGVTEYEVTSEIPLDPILNNLFLVLGGVAQEPGTSFTIVDSNHIRFTSDPGDGIRCWGVTSLSMSSPDIRLVVEAAIQKIVAEGDKQEGRVKVFADAAARSASAAASDAQEVATDKQHVDNVAGQIQGLKIVVNTLNPGEQATASYDPVTGILTLGVPKGDSGDAAIATPTSLGSVMPQTGHEDGLVLDAGGTLSVRPASATQRGSVLASVTAAANTVPQAGEDGALNSSWFLPVITMIKEAAPGIASKDSLGVIKVGEGLAIRIDGTLDVVHNEVELVFTSSEAAWTAPETAVYRITCIGGGGKGGTGGQRPKGETQGAAGGGGGGAATLNQTKVVLTKGDTVAITVGGPGGTSSFGNYAVSAGGAPGGNASANTPGRGGSSTAQAGAAASYHQLGGGAGGAGAPGYGNAISATTGGTGGGNSGVNRPPAPGGRGGTGYGAGGGGGGGGACNYGDTIYNPGRGGNGAPGVVIINYVSTEE